jgi:enoyl-CoA hydratase/carnithine racemase
MAAPLLRIHDGVAELPVDRDLPSACREIVESEHPLIAAVVRIPGQAQAASVVPGDVLTAAIAKLPVPTVAAIEGDALGIPWELALACDLRIAAVEARVGSPDILQGRMPVAGGTQRLVRAVGPTLALRLLLLGETPCAPEALDLGLLHRVAPADQLDACLADILTGFRASAPIALAYAKEAIHSGLELPLTEGLHFEADLAALLQTTADREEGIRAYLDRRSPEFHAR